MGGPAPELRTERLLLRHWRDDDAATFAGLNADPDVMRHFPAPLTRAESDAFAARIRDGLATDAFGLWAVEVPGVAPFIGYVGLVEQRFEAPFTPAVEVGWRLAADYWGRGYAPEAARAALGHGFDTVGLDEIVSMTTVANSASRRVMEKVGLTRDLGGDFEHPRVPEGSPIRPHVLYRMRRSEWSTPTPTA
ncbi:MAG TPA: GNAT family N-acetyltransferase [Jatrophihabitans sp.]|uniref:GNAT family N-acetyltransferase n=1 Tax=Jatrophihabitans sp. TaxID=1932789 RepID=UPI002DFE6513|nr:GNAT family N-acetyltransferase [Jatrophihabitans sp.]